MIIDYIGIIIFLIIIFCFIIFCTIFCCEEYCLPDRNEEEISISMTDTEYAGETVPRI